MNAVVEQIKNACITGNIIPVHWYQTIKRPKCDGSGPSDRPDMLAIQILADIIYWYRPTEVRDESGQIVKYQQKFNGDMLQKSYAMYAEMFCCPKSSVKSSFDNLVNLGMLKREFRTIEGNGGAPLSNVMFVEPVLDAAMTIPKDSSTPSPRNSGGGPQGILGDVYIDYTETTTENNCNGIPLQTEVANVHRGRKSAKGGTMGPSGPLYARKPTRGMVLKHARKIGMDESEAHACYDYYSGKHWKRGDGTRISSWPTAVSQWWSRAQKKAKQERSLAEKRGAPRGAAGTEVYDL